MKKLLISIFDRTGNASRPYREDPNWEVIQIDIQNGYDYLEFDLLQELNNRCDYGCYPTVGVIAMIPCTHDAVSGAKHFKAKDAAGIPQKETDPLVNKLKKEIDHLKKMGILQFWQVENPRTRLHKRHPWLGKIRQRFNPTDYAGYDPEPENSRYNKDTWLFGEFEKMIPKPMEAKYKESPIWSKYGGKSLKTKNARSITPLGFCYAFHHVNN